MQCKVSGRQFRRLYVICLIQFGFTLSVFSAAASAATPEAGPAHDLLKRMAEASRKASYRGTFTYEHGGVLKTFKIFHAVRNGKEYERLVHMNGPEAEVIRMGNSLDCRRASDMLLRGAIIESSIGHGHIGDFYEFLIRGEDRVAGRRVVELHVVPKDLQRYGYVLSIDKESSLLLRAMLVSPDRKQVLERFQFVEVDLDTPVSDEELSNSDSRPMVADVNALPCIDGTEKPASRHWQVGWLPKGFVLVGRRAGSEPGHEALMFADGLAFFTIFIDNGTGLNMPPLQARRGATVAVMSKVTGKSQEFSVCVVGEIPMKSADRVARSLQASIVK